MSVQPSQDRSRDRREQLLVAAIELLAEGGPRAITHRAVAARAGVPPAATTYYFASIQALLDEAFARHAELRSEELRAVVDHAVSRGGSAAQVSEGLAASLVDRAEEAMVAQFEVYLEAWRNPNVRHAVGRALDEFEGLATAALAVLGVEDPARFAPSFVAAVDGFALHRLARPRPRDDELLALRTTLRALFIAAVMDPVERARWDARLEAGPG